MDDSPTQNSEFAEFAKRAAEEYRRAWARRRAVNWVLLSITGAAFWICVVADVPLWRNASTAAFLFALARFCLEAFSSLSSTDGDEPVRKALSEVTSGAWVVAFVASAYHLGGSRECHLGPGST